MQISNWCIKDDHKKCDLSECNCKCHSNKLSKTINDLLDKRSRIGIQLRTQIASEIFQELDKIILEQWVDSKFFGMSNKKYIKLKKQFGVKR